MTDSLHRTQPEIWITDAAMVTALGDDPNVVWKGLFEGRTAVSPVRRFRVDGYRSRMAACIPDLQPRKNHSMLPGLLTRLARKMGPVPRDARLVVATTKGGIDILESAKRGKNADRADLAPWAVAAMASHQFGLKDSGITISAACASSTLAVCRAGALIRCGRADAVLVCCADLVTEFVFSGFSALGALSRSPCRPFDRDRDGLSLGEGAAALLLMDADRALAEGRSALGKVCGWGAAADGYRIIAPSPDGAGLLRAMKEALDRGRLSPEAVGAVCAHGTGTVFNDAMELNAFRDCFGTSCCPPVYSVKGAIGHTLSAAGAIEVALGLRALAEGRVPPTVGFVEPAEGAEDCVSAKPLSIKGDHLLTCNSGFGGINAALVLEKGSRAKTQRPKEGNRRGAAYRLPNTSQPMMPSRAPVQITGVGWVTAAGRGCGRKNRCFGMKPGPPPRVQRKWVTGKPMPHFGRLDAFSKLGLAGIALALQDAGYFGGGCKDRPVGIIASTVYGCLQTDADYFDTVLPEEGRTASPALFSYTLSNCFLGEAAGLFGTTGLSYVIYDERFAGLSSVDAVLLGILCGEFPTGLAGIVDIGVPSVFGTGTEPAPGAAFVVMETCAPTLGPAYGAIEAPVDGGIRFNGKRVSSFLQLVDECLAALHKDAPASL